MMALTLFKWCLRARIATKIPLSYGVRSVASSSFRQCDTCSQRRFGWAAVNVFFFSLFSLSFPRKSCLNFQKMNCVIWYVILSILVHFLLITVYLAFEPFWSLDFVQFHPLTFYSIWFFLFDLIPLLLILYFYVLYFFWLFFSCNFIPFHFITFF
jgi:hypothetical protein